jgi:hypothetical protein
MALLVPYDLVSTVRGEFFCFLFPDHNNYLISLLVFFNDRLPPICLFSSSFANFHMKLIIPHHS